MPAQIRSSFKRAFILSCLLLYVLLNTLRTPLYSQSAKLMVENIEISGNSKTSPQVILDFFDFKKGDQIEKHQLDSGIQRLKDSHFFKKTNVYTQPGTNRGQIIIFIEIEERRWPYFQFKGGYNELDGWYLSPIGLRFDNILGRGNYMGIEFYIGDRLTGLDISFLRNNIFCVPVKSESTILHAHPSICPLCGRPEIPSIGGKFGFGFPYQWGFWHYEISLV